MVSRVKSQLHSNSEETFPSMAMDDLRTMKPQTWKIGGNCSRLAIRCLRNFGTTFCTLDYLLWASLREGKNAKIFFAFWAKSHEVKLFLLIWHFVSQGVAVATASSRTVVRLRAQRPQNKFRASHEQKTVMLIASPLNLQSQRELLLTSASGSDRIFSGCKVARCSSR